MKRIGFLAGLVALLASHAAAQEQPSANAADIGIEVSPAIWRAATDTQADLVRSPGPELDTGLGGHGVAFTADGDNKVVSLQATKTWQDSGDLSDPNPRRLATNNLSGKLFTDVTDKDDMSGYFATDVGRVRGTGFEVGFTRSWSPNLPLPSTADERDEAVRVARQKCRERVGTRPELTPAFCDADLTSLGQIMALLPDEDQVDVLDDPWLRSTVSSIGMTLGAASKGFKYRDPTTLASGETEEINWTAGIHGGQSRILSGIGRVYYGGGVSYRSEYSDADTRTLCAPPPPSGPQECFTSPYGTPEEDKGTTLFLVARNQNSWKVLDIPVVLQIKPAYVVETETLGVEASLYVFAGKGGLRGGLRLALQTDDNDAATDDENARFGIFVGAAF